MIILETQGPIKKTELFVNLLWSFGFVKNYSQSCENRDNVKSFFAIIEDFRYTDHGASSFFCYVWFGHLYYSKYNGLLLFYMGDFLEFMRFSRYA